MKKIFSKDLLILIYALIFGLSIIVMPSISKGQSTTTDDGYTVLVPLPCIEGNGVSCPGGNGSIQEKVDFKTYVQYTFNLFIGLSAVTAVVMIIWGSVEYIVSASLFDKKSGLDKAKNAIYGLILILTSYLILRTVDPRFTQIPNTIVPQITYETYLQGSPYEKLFESVKNDSAKYNLKSVEIGNNIAKTRQDVTQKEEQFKKTDEDLRKLIQNASSSEDREKIKELERQKRLDVEELNKSYIARAYETAKQDVNGQIRNTLNLTSSSISTERDLSLNDTQKLITNINSDKQNIDVTISAKKSEFTYYGELDHTKLDELSLYGKTIIDAKILNLAMNSVQNRQASMTTGGFGGGANFSKPIVLASLTGGEIGFKTKGEALIFIETEINRINSVANVIKDPVLKNEINEQATTLKANLDANKTLK